MPPQLNAFDLFGVSQLGCYIAQIFSEQWGAAIVIHCCIHRQRTTIVDFVIINIDVLLFGHCFSKGLVYCGLLRVQWNFIPFLGLFCGGSGREGDKGF